MKVIPALILFLFFSVLNSALALSSDPESNNQASTPPSAESWMHRLNQVVTSQNYEVVFVHYRAGHETVPYLWRHGLMDDGLEMEQLNLQNGPGREFIRVNNKISVYEPDQRPYSIYDSRIDGPIPVEFLNDITPLLVGYEFIAVGRARISGRSAQQIRIVSRDGSRYSYQLWLDETTAMLLKMNMLDAKGSIIEQIQVSSFVFSPDAHPYFTRVNQASLPKVMAMPPSQMAKHAWRVSFIPVGMQEIKADKRRLAISGNLVEHRLFSDGLVDVSVYVEPAKQSFNQDLLLRHELNTFLSLTNGAVQVTVVGEIPHETAHRMANSLTLENN